MLEQPHSENIACKILGISVVFFLTFTSTSVFANEDGNLLQNSSFETGLSQWKVTTTYDPNIKPDVKQIPGAGRDKSNALSIKSTLTGKVENKRLVLETVVTQCVRLPNAPGYRLSGKFQYKDSPGDSVFDRLEAVWFDNETCTGSGQWGMYADPQPKTGWQSLSCLLKPTIAAKSVQVRLLQRTRESGGIAALWDDVSLIPVAYQPYPGSLHVVANEKNGALPFGENYLINPNFLNDLDAWSPTNISRKKNKEINEFHVKWDAKGAEDKGSARFEATSTTGYGTGVVDQCVNLGGRTLFEMGAKVKSGSPSSTTGGVRLRITWYEDLNCRGRNRMDSNWKDYEKSSNWMDLKVTGLKPIENAKSAEVEITGGLYTPGAYTAYLDNFYFVAVEQK